MSLLKKIVFAVLVVLIFMNFTNYDFILTIFFLVIAAASIEHVIVYKKHASFKANCNLTDDYEMLLSEMGLNINEDYAVVKKRIGNRVKTYNTRYKFGLYPVNMYVNYYFRTKGFKGMKKRMKFLKERLSAFEDYHNLSWKNDKDELVVVYVKSSPKTEPKITKLEFEEIISAVGG